MKKFLTRLHIFLSHHSFLYALIAGVGIVLFWRGVWHTTDLVHLYMSNSQAVMDHTWWDGPLSFLTGCLILYITRAFVSSFIGNELILSGLRTEKKMTRQATTDLKEEVTVISDIKQEIGTIVHKLEDLDAQVRDHHTN